MTGSSVLGPACIFWSTSSDRISGICGAGTCGCTRGYACVMCATMCCQQQVQQHISTPDPFRCFPIQTALRGPYAHCSSSHFTDPAAATPDPTLLYIGCHRVCRSSAPDLIHDALHALDLSHARLLPLGQLVAVAVPASPHLPTLSHLSPEVCDSGMRTHSHPLASAARTASNT